MMPKIRISSKQGFFIFTYADENRNKNINLTQTNIINTDSMIFTTNYISKNIDIVSSFIYSIAVQRNISKIIVNNIDLAPIALLIVKDLKNINEIEIKPDEEITYEIYERLLFSPYIEKVSCYSMKEFMLEQLDKNHKSVETRREILFVSNFMIQNNLDNYASIYYKKNIVINDKFTDKDIIDFEIFCKENKHLKTVEVNYFSREIIRTIINILARNKLFNIKINIMQNNENIDDILSSINYLKIVQSKIKDNYNYKLTIIYSDEYKKKNILSQLTINNIKVCCFLIIIVVSLGMLIMEYNNAKAVKNITEINDFISSEIATITDNTSFIPEKVSSIIYDEYSSSSIIEVETTEDEVYQRVYNEIFTKLLKQNKETVGYLKVNNTNIDYPIVKTNDNKYYLSHDFYNKINTFGWVFMDYRNNEYDLNHNTILYGHNSKKGIMFSSLVNTLESSWYSEPSNQIITFNTLYYMMEWQVFAIYKVDVTSDYLTTNFATEDEFQNFINLIRSRSIYNFKVDVDTTDRILTLSTCIDNSKRRVVLHAKLISQKPIDE